MSGVPPFQTDQENKNKVGTEAKNNTLSNRPLLSANIVKNSSVDVKCGRLYIFCSLSCSVRANMSSTVHLHVQTFVSNGARKHYPPTAIGSSISSTLITFLNNTLPLLVPVIFPSSKPSSSNTTPGESTTLIPRSSWIDCSSLVCPGCAATEQT